MNTTVNDEKDLFVFANKNDFLHDQKLETKPVGYLKDAFYRFSRNKASITAAIIIIILFLYAIIVPIFSRYTVSYNDSYFRWTLPRSEINYNLGIHFYDGCSQKSLSKEQFYLYYAMGVETGHNAVLNQKYSIKESVNLSNKTVYSYTIRLDSYQLNGVVFMSLNASDYQALQAYQDATGIQVIYPMTDPKLRPTSVQVKNDANYWFKTSEEAGKPVASVVINEDNTIDFTNIYMTDTLNPLYTNDGYTSTVRVNGDNGEYIYAIVDQTGYNVRVNYYEYYIYYHKTVLKDRISKPSFFFGTTNYGQDIFTCLASGARFSFILAILVATVNLVFGAIYGAIEGYYGNRTDLIMERISDILSAIPFIVVITLLKYHMSNVPQAVILFLAFFATGWIGMAGTTRMQFYRFKNQEYVLAARTLGARDGRIMFKHIFPNAIGTLITSCVLVIPSVIFSETSLSYLNIINLSSGSMTSVGTLLASGQGYLTSYPHMIFYPAVFISLLMLSFNLFGNGLRDAFNPSLRGSEE